MKILVTGADGQLGKSIQDMAKKYSHLGFIFTDYKELDITDPIKINVFFRENTFEYCINCAAYTAVDKAEVEKDKAFLLNAEAAKYLSEACREHGATLIHISTDFVFDGEKGTPYTEEDKPNPINIYGASKLKGEQYVQNILEKHFVIRTSWVYSEYGHNFVKTMLRLAEERNEISVVNDQIGSPTYAGDLAEVILGIIWSESKNYGLYNYSNKGAISWYDFASAIFSDYNSNVKIFPTNSGAYSSPTKRPKFSVMDQSKVREILDVEIPHWRDSMGKCLNRIDQIQS